jgi:hypothetical protein
MLRHQGEGATLSRTLRETLNRQVILHSGKRVLGYSASEGKTHVFGPGGMERHSVRDATDILGITTGRCEAAYLAVRCPPTHSGMPHQMPPTCRVSLVVPRERGIACDTALKVRASSPGEGIALLSIVARSCYELLRLATAYFPETAREARKLLFDTVVWYYPKGLIGS